MAAGRRCAPATRMATDPSLIAALQPQRISDRCDALGRLSELDGGLTRVFLSPEQRQASDRVLRWMREAGMARTARRHRQLRRAATKASDPGSPCLMLGSHLDTVRDAGKYDGMLGVISAIECVQRAACARRAPAVRDRGRRLRRRGRRALRLDAARQPRGGGHVRSRAARQGATRTASTMRDALRGFGLDPGADRRRRAQAGRRARLRRAAHRAGAGARSRRPAGGRGHRDQRRQPLQHRD